MSEPKFRLVAFTIDRPHHGIVVETGLSWDRVRQEKTEIASHGLYMPESDAHNRQEKPVESVPHTWYPLSSIVKLVAETEPE
jgi:hypothetical protein